MAYLTYSEYQTMGGKADETAFNSMSKFVEARMNYITFGRLAEIPVDKRPTCLKDLEFKLLTISEINNTDTIQSGISSYSNGIESISFGKNSTETTNIEKSVNLRFAEIMKIYLYDYPELFYRGRSIV